jgi:hypothetical protein
MMDILDGEVDTRSVLRGSIASENDLNKLKAVSQYLKDLSEKGLSAWKDSPGSDRYYHYGKRGLITDFFNGSYDYLHDRMVADFQKEEKLAVQKFVKFIRDDIRRIVSIYTTGQWDGDAIPRKKAGDYNKERRGW